MFPERYTDKDDGYVEHFKKEKRSVPEVRLPKTAGSRGRKRRYESKPRSRQGSPSHDRRNVENR